MATRLAESLPSRRNLRPMPGAVVREAESGWRLRDILRRPWVAPWKSPV